ncbi:hypothetical protein SMICM304S_03409 [Streptomyces microflavus]
MPGPFPVHSTPVTGTAATAPVSRSGWSRVPSGCGAARAVSPSSAASESPAVLPQRGHPSRDGGGTSPPPCHSLSDSSSRRRWSGTAARAGTPCCGIPESRWTIRAIDRARRSVAPSTGWMP